MHTFMQLEMFNNCWYIPDFLHTKITIPHTEDGHLVKLYEKILQALFSGQLTTKYTDNSTL